jgi:hypothetical protein
MDGSGGRAQRGCTALISRGRAAGARAGGLQAAHFLGIAAFQAPVAMTLVFAAEIVFGGRIIARGGAVTHLA